MPGEGHWSEDDPSVDNAPGDGIFVSSITGLHTRRRHRKTDFRGRTVSSVRESERDEPDPHPTEWWDRWFSGAFVSAEAAADFQTWDNF